jgi:xanthosine phosphorylase
MQCFINKGEVLVRSSKLNDRIDEAAALIQARAEGLRPEIAVVLGSGLGAVADLLDERASISYDALPGFSSATVSGHEGVLKIGTVSGVPVFYLKGRTHLYEGVGADPIKVMIRTLKKLGVRTLVLTNACGGLHEDLQPGSIMLISDHINRMGSNPLTGPNDDEWGPRFPAQEDSWNQGLRRLMLAGAAQNQVRLTEGVYSAHLGPTFETPAEIRAARIMGADAVGMSTVPENIIARHCGMACVGLAAIVNRAAGMGFEKPSHEQTLIGARMAAGDMAKIIQFFIENYNDRSISESA